MQTKLFGAFALFALLFMVLILSGLAQTPSEAAAEETQLDIHNYTKGDVSNFPVYPRPTAGEPAKGESVYDSNYGTTVVKVADAKEFSQDESGGIIRPVYSRWRIDNSAGDLYYLVKGGGTPPGSGRGVMVLFYSANDSIYKIATEVEGYEGSEFRWDYSGNRPYVMYYVEGTQFREYNVKTGETRLVRDFVTDFPDAERILNDVEGDSSADSRYWAWMVQGHYDGEYFPMLAIITYDRQSNTILGTLDYSKYKSMGGAESTLPRPNMVDISPLGTKVVVLWGRTDRFDSFDGPHAYDFDFSNPIKVSNDETHSGWAFDYNGDEVYVSQINNVNWAAVDADTIAYVNIQTGEVNAILYFEDMGWDMGGVHFGRFYDSSIRGFVYMTTYSDASSESPMRNTAAMLEIKPYTQHPRVWRITDTCNSFPNPEEDYEGAYMREAFSPISGDGTAIYWAGDWPGGDGTVDTYKVQLPENWWVTLRSAEDGSDSTNPKANAGPDQTANAGASVSFDAGASSDNVGIVSYGWNFGDGTTGTGKTITHAYASAGTYTVTLTVKDAAGNSATDTMTVAVSPAGGVEGFPPWIIGVIIAAIAIILVVVILFWRRRK